MTTTAHVAYGLIGGGATDLDYIDGTDLSDGDMAFVYASEIAYFYKLDADSAAAESSPAIISPDTNAGDKRWILQGVNGSAATFTSVSTVDLTVDGNDVGAALMGDGTKGRVLRRIRVKFDDGTNASTLKVTVSSNFNGDAIAETNNIAKDATTGNFSLNAAGNLLTIEAAGLSGNCVAVLGGEIWSNASGTTLNGLEVYAGSNDIKTTVYSGATAPDMTSLVDGGIFYMYITYLTDA